jgi:hypothetical protein
MINLNAQLCKELDLTYWQLQQTTDEVKFTINRDEKELLRKILLAKGISLHNDMIQIKADGIVIVRHNHYQLVFGEANNIDSNNTIHLAKLSNMLNDNEQKKITWYKLKNINF